MRCLSPNQNQTNYTIYVASKTHHGPMWRNLRSKGVPIISTWIDEWEKGVTQDFSDLWQRCIQEVSFCSYFLIYREPDEIIKDALVELGVALGLNIPVHAVGLQDYSFHAYKPIKHYNDLDGALEGIRLYHKYSFIKLMHPGEFLLKEYMLPFKISFHDLFRSSGISEMELMRLVAGDLDIDPDYADRLGKVLSTPKERWLEMQDQFNQRKEKSK